MLRAWLIALIFLAVQASVTTAQGGTVSTDPNFQFQLGFANGLTVFFATNATHSKFRLSSTAQNGYVAMGVGTQMLGSVVLVGMDPAQNPPYPPVGIYTLISKLGSNAQVMKNTAITAADMLNQFGVSETSFVTTSTTSDMFFTVELAKQGATLTFVGGTAFDQPANVIYAAGAPQFSFHTIYGTVGGVNFASGTSPAAGTTGVQMAPLMAGHIAFMFLAWFIFAPLGIIMPLFNSTKHSNRAYCGLTAPTWLKGHWVFLTLAVLCCIIGFALGYDFNGPPHFVDNHGQTGLVVFLLSLVLPVWGFLRPPKAKTGDAPTLRRKIFENGHPTLGYLTLLLGMIDMLLGITEFQNNVVGGSTYLTITGGTATAGFKGGMGTIFVLIFVAYLLILLYGFWRHYTSSSAKSAETQLAAGKMVDEESREPARRSRFSSLMGKKEVFTMSEIMRHTSELDCWVIYDNKVYDVTRFIGSHPGGRKAIMQYAGRDITDAFTNVGHSQSAVTMLKALAIGVTTSYKSSRWSLSRSLGLTSSKRPSQQKANAGTLETVHESKSAMPAPVQYTAEPVPYRAESPSNVRPADSNKFLAVGNSVRQTVTVADKTPVNHNVFILKLAFDSPTKVLGLPIGKHICLYAPNVRGIKPNMWNGKPDVDAGKPEISRKYTPVSTDKNDVGYFTIIVKIYRPDSSKGFPDGGKMSRFLDGLRVGDTVQVAGPFGAHEYLGKGVFTENGTRVSTKHIGMVAGGSGITPMLQIAKAMLNDPEDPCRISLVYANSTTDDVLLKTVLDSLEAKYPKRFQVWYTVSIEPHSHIPWKYSVGRISSLIIQKRLPPPGLNSLVLVCGPSPMNETAFSHLVELGYSDEQIMEY